MKEEQKQSIELTLRFLVFGVFCYLYAIGGSGDFWGGQIWIRRWLAPFILCAAGAILSKGDWRSYAVYPLMCGALCLPYGADVLWQKILLRLMCGVAAGIAFNLYDALCWRILLAGTGLTLALTASVVLGAFNPLPNAILEQGAIAACFAFPYIFSVRPRRV